jgi:hypothetical protein
LANGIPDPRKPIQESIISFFGLSYRISWAKIKHIDILNKITFATISNHDSLTKKYSKSTYVCGKELNFWSIRLRYSWKIKETEKAMYFTFYLEPVTDGRVDVNGVFAALLTDGLLLLLPLDVLGVVQQHNIEVECVTFWLKS